MAETILISFIAIGIGCILGLSIGLCITLLLIKLNFFHPYEKIGFNFRKKKNIPNEKDNLENVAADIKRVFDKEAKKV